MTTDFDALIDDYLGSQQFLFQSSGSKEQIPALLGSFASACRASGISQPINLTIDKFEEILFNQMARLDLPLPDRREIPVFLRDFFEYCSESGRFPPAAAWTDWIDSLDKKYQAGFREDGSVRGETFRKNYSDVNRNDPCPCGSGKKFKKCCMGLIE
jgi:hypothetical protein